jgi:hypothetical protein
VRRLAVALIVMAGCIGPNLIPTRDDDNGRGGGIVSFHGRENIGYVDARVMQERTDDALALAHDFCDGGVEVNEKRSEGGENFIDFKCAVAVAPVVAKPCAEVAPAAEAAPPPAAAPATDTSDTPPEKPKKKRR